MLAPLDTLTSRIRAAMFTPVDIAALVVFRLVFGLTVVVSVARHFWYGWIELFYYQRDYHFTFWPFEFVEPLPAPGMYIVYAVLGLCGLCIALGLYYRQAASLFVVVFGYTQLIDQTNYLNHYYFLWLVGLLLVFLPLHRAASLDAWRRPEIRATEVPGWVLWVIRCQIGVVYVFAGIAKLEPHWLLDGEPLGIWLSTNADFPLIGGFVDSWWLPLAMSWAGMLFDLTIFFWLVWRRTRPFAYATVVAFHVGTGLLLNIGMFPWIMIGLTLVFFAPDWPRRRLPALTHRLVGPRGESWGPKEVPGTSDRLATMRRRRLVAAALAGWFAIQIALPLRHLAYPGDVLWTQEGYDLSWRVMLTEKAGSFKLRVVEPGTGRRWVVRPEDYMDRRQIQLASGSPDMMLAFVHDVGREFAERGHPDVAIYVDSWLSFNGQPAQRFLDPSVDLADKPRGLVHYDWVLPKN